MEYVKPNKFKNMNCGYAVVNGIVFSSIRQAEVYCNKKEIPLDNIRACSEDSFAKAKEISRNFIPNLERIISDIGDVVETTTKAEILTKQEKINKLNKKPRDILAEAEKRVLEEYMAEDRGKLEAYYRVLEYLLKILHETQSVAYKKSAGIE